MVGMVFLLASYLGVATNPTVGLAVITTGSVLAIISLFVTNFSSISTQNEMKESAHIAHQIAQGEINFDFDESDVDEKSELKMLLQNIALDLKEKANIADRINSGDISAQINLHSETDAFGKTFRSMLEKLQFLQARETENKQLQKSIMMLLNDVTEVASGNLTVKAKGTSEVTEEIAEAFNFMTGELRSLIGQVKEVSFQVGNSAQAINETTDQLARGSEAQALQIARMDSTVANIVMQVQEVSNNASLSAQVAGDSLSNARYGSQAVQDNINAMNSIRNQVQETAKRIKKLGERSQEISQIVQLIDDLSDRTSLLALNASLKAAAAGESGHGFAVVAEEVERLAERSNRLTQQIAGLTQMIQIETKDVVASMEETIYEVVVGSTLADRAGQALIEIEQVSQRLAELIGSISESAKEQERNSEDISNAMMNISKVTELVNVGSKRAADSVKMLVVLSDELRGSVATFKLPEEKKYKPNSVSGNGLYLN